MGSSQSYLRQAAAGDPDLITRFFLLEKDLQLAQAEITKKEAVIQYLLYSKLDRPTPDQDAEKLKRVIFSLTEKIAVYEEHFDQGREATEIVADKAEDLIDLSVSGEASEGAKVLEEDTTLLEDSYDDLSDSEEPLGNSMPATNLADSFSSDRTEDSTYAVRRFINRSVDSSSPSGPVSASTSFDSLRNEGKDLLVSAWKEAASNGNFNSKLLLPQKVNVDTALETMRALNYPLPLINMVEEIGTVPELSPESDVDTLAPEPRWEDTKLFDSKAERDYAININRRSAGVREVAYPDFFRHGIRYVPRSTDRYLYRTVTISNLPADVTMTMLLHKIRGGMIVDAQLLNTGSITGSLSALVTFLHEHSAMAYEEHVKNHPIEFLGTVPHISLVPTPTWPIPVNLWSGIFDHGRTRCFEVHGYPRYVPPAVLKSELLSSPVMKSTSLEAMKMGADGVLRLYFSSIRAASQSSYLFTRSVRYRGCEVKFLPDPCAQPLETIHQTAPLPPLGFEPELAALDQSDRLDQINSDSNSHIAHGKEVALEA
ncbi:hypothetical protein P7C71_g6422, partial [Lecanoromycetidae sp. Uapishka_2]